MPITPLPTPVPSRADPANFAVRGDTFLGALPTFATEANALAEEVNENAAICQSAAQTVNVSAWISGFGYADGANVYDPVTFLTYRRKGAGSGSTRPALDGTNWQLLTGFGDVDSVSNQAIGGNKSFTGTISVGTTDISPIGSIEIGVSGTGDRTAFLDFHSHGTPSQNDFSARVIRNPGANGDLLIQNTGTGQVKFAENGIDQSISNAGEVSMFARNTAPAGWLKANGAAVSRTTYAALFAAIGTTFGVGNGSTTFNVPDLRGEFIRGWDDGRGVDSGRVFGSAQAGEIQSHTHNVTYGSASNTSSVDPSRLSNGGLTTVATAATGGTETRPRNVALLSCIKF